MKRHILVLTFCACFLTLVFTPTPLTAATNSAIERVSVATGGAQGNNNSYSSKHNVGVPSISTDGRYVVFDSLADNLVPGDTNGFYDVFVHDRQTDETTRVSVSSDETQGNKASYGGAVSGDGHFVTFSSEATNLVANDFNGQSDVFVRDLQNGETTRISVKSNGSEVYGISFDGSISADGRYIAFEAEANAYGYGSSYRNVFVHDRQTGQTTLVSVNNQGGIANYLQDWPSISADGRFVIFESASTNLVDNDANGSYTDVFIRDLVNNETSLVSVATDGTQRNEHSSHSSISADGRYVVFNNQGNLTNDGGCCVYVRDRQTQQTTLVSANSGEGSISGDGRYVAFVSTATDLISGSTDDTRSDSDIFVRDLVDNKTIRISNPAGQSGSIGSFLPTISGDGKFVTYESNTSNQVSNDNNGVWDVFVAPVVFPTPPQMGSFRQTSEPWGDDLYASHLADSKAVSQWTVYSSGCFITSVVNIMHYWGVKTTNVNGVAEEVNPGNINKYLNEHGGYDTKAGYPYWPSISHYAESKIGLSYLRPENWKNDKAVREQVVNEQLALDPPQPVMVQVPSTLGQRGHIDWYGHWVVITGPKVNGHYPIRDPGILGATSLEAYNDEFGDMRLVKPASGYKPEQTFRVYSPVELMITDALGRRTGYDPLTQTFMNEIPEADYGIEYPIVDQVTNRPIGEAVKVLRVPQNTAGQYQLTVSGTGNGHYGLDFETVDVNGNFAIQYQEGIATTGINTEYPYAYDGATIALDQQLTAHAGADQTVTDSNNNGSEPVMLDGSGSTDSNGTIVSYTWVENDTIIATGMKPTLNLTLGTHSISLIVKDDSGAQNSDTLVITVLNSPDAIPARNYYTTHTPTLTWNRVTSAATYQIQVDNTLNFSSALDFTASVPADQLSTPTTFLDKGTYYWRVRACPAVGACGNWSAVDSFVVDS